MLRNVIVTMILLGTFALIALLDVILPDAVFFLVLGIIMFLAVIFFHKEG